MLKTQGVAFDVGIRYITGKDDNLKFGIALRNVGPKMKYMGDGLTVKTEYGQTKNLLLIQDQKVLKCPRNWQIGLSYDFFRWTNLQTQLVKTGVSNDRFTLAGNICFSIFW